MSILATEVPEGFIGIGEAFEQAKQDWPPSPALSQEFCERAIEFFMRKAFAAGELPVYIWNGHDAGSILIARDRQDWAIALSDTFGRLATYPRKWQDVLYCPFPRKYGRNPKEISESMYAFFLKREDWKAWLADRTRRTRGSQRATASDESAAIKALTGCLTVNNDMKRGNAFDWCRDQGFNLTARGFQARVWPKAREKAGLDSRAPSGRKKGSKSSR